MRDLMEREQRAREYSQRVRERRKIRATWIITAIEVCLLVYSIVLAVAICKGGDPL